MIVHTYYKNMRYVNWIISTSHHRISNTYLETFLLYGPSIIHIYYVGKFIFLTLPLPYVCKHKLSTYCKNSKFKLCVALKKCFFGVSMNTYLET